MANETKNFNNNPFRAASGLYFTRGLFREKAWENPESAATPVYTLQDEDIDGYKSLYRLYMEEEDITEFVFANKYLANNFHWEKLCNVEFFKPYVERWRKELRLKLKARALEAIVKESKDPNSKNYYVAAKYLAEQAYDNNAESRRAKAGRKSKQDIREEAERLNSSNLTDKNQIMEDAERLLTPKLGVVN